MENLHLKNLDLEKAFKKSKIEKLPEQIKSHIPIGEDDEEYEDNRLMNLICNTVFGILIFAHVVLAMIYPERIIALGYSLFGL
jgi:hypothetical protein